MIFSPTKLAGAYLIEPERHEDERGHFARTWCAREFAERGLPGDLAQCNLSFNARRGTLRGMHYAVPPNAEAKLVRATRGSVWDCLLDLRLDSPTYRQWVAFELNETNQRQLFVPIGLAHGFITLADNTEVFYQMSEFFDASAARGVRWNDPAFGIAWPEPVTVISARDASYPLA